MISINLLLVSKMVKYVGGRGKKAPYQTVVTRIPVDIQPQVDKLVQEFKDGVDSTSEVVTLIKRYQSESKNTRDWTKANNLISELSVLLGLAND